MIRYIGIYFYIGVNILFNINQNFLELPQSYLFSDIAKRVAAFQSANTERSIIRLGMGDVTRPLVPAVTSAMKAAVDDMGRSDTFRGYRSDNGYEFLREAILEKDYHARGVKIEMDEIFISDGAKSDTGNFADILDIDNIVAVCDPVYPVYVDANAMSGRGGDFSAETGKWSNYVYLPCLEENGFIPQLPSKDQKAPDMIYLCFPNNPTGAAATREQLQGWVNYANENGSLILFDSAYEAFITEDLPHSIFEIPGAERCAVEFRSFSKTAGFTGVRCGYTIVPKALKSGDVMMNKLWSRRQDTKFNGVSYIVQKGAEAVYTEVGQNQIKDTIAYYLGNAKVIKEGLAKAGFEVSGGVNAPYIWMKTPNGLSSWEFFDLLLDKAGVVGTPGSGFGPSGEGFFRLTAFGSRENSEQAIERIVNQFTSHNSQFNF